MCRPTYQWVFRRILLKGKKIERKERQTNDRREPGLVVMGGDSGSIGWGFKSQHHILDGHFFTLICYKFFVDVYLKKSKINIEEAGDSQLKNRQMNKW